MVTSNTKTEKVLVDLIVVIGKVIEPILSASLIVWLILKKPDPR